ncbi:hypothetical protein Tsubulata_009830 [Turnera subulata]|uniref:F-box domain-containing protein n=1 Tax=Turnera subulata TaxID=218843 RepID=A0A9Q0G639_9ROSI|nr:hypothetical protein Tsubulata_009830 [Turnera subulata]
MCTGLKELKMTDYVPADMIAEILSRLPTKSLHRFRCVCKSLHTLLNSRFIRSATMKRNRQKLLMLCATDHHYYSVYSILDLSTMVLEKHEIPFTISDQSSKYSPLWNSLSSPTCDGWLALYNGKKRLLFNLSTKEYREFPLPYKFRPLFESLYVCCSWFYYDSYLDDYKLVAVMTNIDRGYLLGVFSFKRDCWTKIIAFPHAKHRDYDDFSILNGNPHWVVTNWPEDDEDWVPFCSTRFVRRRSLIYGFDLDGDRLIQVPQPPGKYLCDSATLAVISDHLCAFCSCDSKFSLWEMKQYMVMDSWTKLCTITLPYLPYILKPLAFTENDGQVLILSEKQEEILVYDPQERACRSVFKFEERLPASKIINYREV